MNITTKRFLKQSTSEWFLFICAVVLLITGGLKLWSAASGSTGYLESPSMLKFITNRQLFVLAGLIEVFAANRLFTSGSVYFRALFAAWLGTIFLSWRIAMWLTGYRLCPCLGTAYDWLGVDTFVIDLFLKCVIGFMMIGGYGFAYYWRRRIAII